MNYIGSKLSLLEFLESSMNKVINSDCQIFCDLFAGTGVVGSYFKKKGFKIIANDIQYYSYVLNRHYIKNHKELEFKKLFSKIPELRKAEIESRKNIVFYFLNNLKGREGFIYNNYCLGGTKNKKEPRQYFSDENGKRCDAIRKRIEDWKKKRLINNDEYYFLLASLIESVDKHANTASVYGAFLKKLKRSALKPFILTPAPLIINKQEHEVYNDDINRVIRKVKGDILYLDPPYNQRQYATNYHILETIARYDSPTIFGKTGLREYQAQKSAYCSRNQVKESFRDLILNANVRYIFLSYNNEGLMSADDIKEIMSLRGKYGHFVKEYNRFRADKNKNRDFSATKTTEYLHYVVCD
jgi:adenine-specific DNA-methyltransferase